MSYELIQDAIQCFGTKIVNEVMEIVYCSDPDCAYTYYQDVNKEEHAECVEMLFFG